MGSTLLDEKRAKALIIASFGKNKLSINPLEYAKCFEFLCNQYGSIEFVIKQLKSAGLKKIGYETVRIWLEVAKAAESSLKFRHLISKGLVPRTVAFELIPLGDRKRQAEVGEAIAGFPSSVARWIIREASKNPRESATKVRDRVLEQIRKMSPAIVAFALPEEAYKAMQRKSKDTEEWVRRVVINWLGKGEPPLEFVKFEKKGLQVVTVTFPKPIFKKLQKKGNPADIVKQIIMDRLKNSLAIKN